MSTDWIKIIEVYGRKEGFTREEFLAYQSGPHMLAAGKVPEFCGRIRNSYQGTILLPQEHPEIAAINQLPETDLKDSVVEIFFDSPKEAYAAFHEPRYLEIVRPDEEYFSDTKNGWSVMAREKILYEAKTEGTYLMYLFWKWNASADNSWEKEKADLVALAQDLNAKLLSENARITESSLENGRDYDLVLKLSFDSMDDLMEAIRNRNIHSYLKDKVFIDQDSMITYCAVEKRAVPIS